MQICIQKVKVLLEQWRSFLLEERVKYQGILKMGLEPLTISKAQALQAMLPEEAVRLKDDDLHVTLIHQSILNPFSKKIKDINILSRVNLELEEIIKEAILDLKTWKEGNNSIPVIYTIYITYN